IAHTKQNLCASISLRLCVKTFRSWSAFVAQEFDNLSDGLLQAQLMSGQFEFRSVRGFIWRGNSGEFLDFVGAGFGVEALGIARLADVERRVHEDLYELSGLHALADGIAVRAVGRNECGDADEAGVSHNFGHLADAADVLAAVFR